MSSLNRGLHRRRVLRGMLNGSAVTVALPLLNCFLNGNGDALADGTPMPLRFGTWFWGCGASAKVFVPAKIGRDYALPEEISCFAPIQSDMNLFTNLMLYRDASPNLCHHTGWVIMRAGQAPATFADFPGETVDVSIANQIGRPTRFPSLSATATADVRNIISYQGANSPTIPEVLPFNFYAHLFGSGFQDPNAPTFTPSPLAMVRKSVLSGVAENAQDLRKDFGAEDRARLDEYFTGIRHLESQLEHQLTKPEPIAACHPTQTPPEDIKIGLETSQVQDRHRLLTDLMAMAVACDQTRVFNMMYSAPIARTVKHGYEKPHHTTTHEEPVDSALGYQPTASWFSRRAFEEWVYFVQAFKNVKEGDGTLLDNVFIIATTDHGNARIHSLDAVPAFTAGHLGGKVKTGLHIDGAGRQGTMLALTAMKLMGVEKVQWGKGSNATSKEFGEILA